MRNRSVTIDLASARWIALTCALALTACDAEPPTIRVHQKCVAYNGSEAAQRIADCAGSAASDEGEDIVQACESAIREALCTRRRWTYSADFKDERPCAWGDQRAKVMCRAEGWDGK